jgi:hypothetical protein
VLVGGHDLVWMKSVWRDRRQLKWLLNRSRTLHLPVEEKFEGQLLDQPLLGEVRDSNYVDNVDCPERTLLTTFKKTL